MIFEHYLRRPRGDTFALRVLICSVVTLAVPVMAVADVISGVEASTAIGTTNGGDGGTVVGRFTQSSYFGGNGTNSVSFDELSAMGSANLNGSMGTAANSPFLRLRADGPSSPQANSSYVGALAAYQYNSTGSATVTYEWFLTATLTEPPNTSAFLRARTALITDTEFFSTSYVDFFESGLTVEDNIVFTQNTAGVVNETGTISFIANRAKCFI